MEDKCKRLEDILPDRNVLVVFKLLLIGETDDKVKCIFSKKYAEILFSILFDITN